MTDDDAPDDVPGDGAAAGDRAGGEAPAQPTAEEQAAEQAAEDRFKKLTAVTLAILAVLGAGIAIVMTNASTQESTTAREATRTAAAAEAANVLVYGADQAVARVQAEVATMDLRRGLNPDPAVAEALGVDLDPAELAAIRVEAEASVTSALGDGSTLFDMRVEANRLSLRQAALVDERVTWNARASQYETVVTVLGVALFLIGFTVLVRRRTRPPLFVPGLLLAVYCVGWTVHIYLKPIPYVAPESIEATARGQAQLGTGQTDEAIASFDEAIAADDDYIDPLQGRAQALLLVANPDLLNTLAITNDDPADTAKAVADLQRAAELSDTPEPLTGALLGLAAITTQDWAVAAGALDVAIAENRATPGLQFARSAVAVAQGDADGARRFRSQAVDAMGPLDLTDRNQTLISQYLSLLRYVAHSTPDQAELAETFLEEAVLAETTLLEGEPSGSVPDGAAVSIVDLAFDRGTTTIDLAWTGFGPDDIVSLIGFEQPAEGAAFVQPAELLYIGPAARGSGITVQSPRACVPVAYQFEVWINGVRQPSLEHPGTTPTC